MAVGQSQTTSGPQVLVHVSFCQGKPFWVPIFDPQPCPNELPQAGDSEPAGATSGRWSGGEWWGGGGGWGGWGGGLGVGKVKQSVSRFLAVAVSVFLFRELNCGLVLAAFAALFSLFFPEAWIAMDCCGRELGGRGFKHTTFQKSNTRLLLFILVVMPW